MKQQSHILFPPFHLDPINEQLWRGQRVVSLRRKSLTVLSYLVERPGRLITHEELLNALWPGTCVSDSAVKGCVRELRKALGDTRQAPRFIETVQGRGYRFVGKIIRSQKSVASGQYPVVGSPKQSGVQGLVSRATSTRVAVRHPHSAVSLVGRETEMAQLQGWLEKALRGERQLIFVTGEPGIGKTTLVDAFVQRLVGNRALRVGRGQCVETYGSGEAYLPVLDALGRLCREPGGERVIALLTRCAPTWLAQMPWLLYDAALEALQRKIQGATRERMLRELTETGEALTAETPLILVLEDLQWSDYSTLDLLSVLARRQEVARLLMIGTYRPADVNTAGHPLQRVKQELQLHGYCRELPLRLLSETDVAEYLAARFAFLAPSMGKPCLESQAFLQQLAQLIHQRTDGNPLFIVNVVDSLIAQGVIVESPSVETRHVTSLRSLEEVLNNIPDSLQQMIENQFKRLRREKPQGLEAASTGITAKVHLFLGFI